MIIVKLKGGLGNQMFQYAHALSVSKQKNDPEIKLDLSAYKKDDLSDLPRAYGLQHFSITHTHEATNEDLQSIKAQLSFSQRVRRKIRTLLFPASFVTEYDATYQSKDGNTYYLDGFFQSTHAFCEVSEVVRNEFVLREPLSDAANTYKIQIQNTHSISLHVRRGDYLLPQNSSHFAICPLTYYESAIALFQEKFSDIHFFVFSDDISWAKENLKLQTNVTYVSSPDIKDYEELMLMSLCKHHIIANSTFSWWGAWLNKNDSKIVISPKDWFEVSSYQSTDLLPNSWLLL